MLDLAGNPATPFAFHFTTRDGDPPECLSAGKQALCVTHLAQVAVYADRQIRVSKSAGAAGSRVELTVLGQEERVDEVARMLGGQLSEQSRAHASELLGEASAIVH